MTGRLFRSATQDSSSDSLKIPIFFLTFAGLIEAYATIFANAPVTQLHDELHTQSLICILLIGVLGTAYWVVAGPSPAPATDRRGSALRWLAFLVPAYALLQVAPLPPAWVPISAAPSETLFHCLLFAACAVMFLVLFDLSKNLPLRPWMVVTPLIVIAAAQAFIGLLQLTGYPNGIATGTWLNRNHYAGFLAMILPFPGLYPFAVLTRRGHVQENPRKHGGAVSILLACLGFAITALLFSAIVASQSRIGFIALLAVIVFIAVLARGFSPRRIWLTSAGITFTAVLLFFLLPAARPAWHKTLTLIKTYPIFGCGLGACESAAPTPDDAPVAYLQYLAELGVVGFALALFPLSLILASLPSGIRHIRPDTHWLSLACAGSLLTTAIHSFVDLNLFVPANMFTLAWILGVAAFLGAWSSRNEGLFFEPTVIVLPPPRPAQPTNPR